MSNSPQPAAPSRWRDTIIFALGAVLFTLIVFRDIVPPGHILFTTDDNIGALALRRSFLPQGFLGAWDDSAAVGQVASLSINWTHLLLSALPVSFSTNWLRPLDLLLASIFIFLFLRNRGLRIEACALAALTSCWLGSTFFLIYAGHINKFAVVMFAAMYLWLIDLAVRRNSWSLAVLAGGAMGGMFLEQVDSGLFFALPLGAYALFAAWREFGKRIGPIARIIVPVVLVAGLLAFRPIASALATFSIESSEANARSAQEGWDYCTQWSWPPEETIEWIAPGYTGWRSGEPTGPYWGRMGRSAEWAQSQQGFMNFKLETLYIGIIPVAFMFLACAAAFLKWPGSFSFRSEVLFWIGAALLTFLLGLGKYFPLYRIFYQLPGISSIRNPVKFMQVTQMAIGIAAAYGLNALLTRSADSVERQRLRRFATVLLVLGGLFGFWWLSLVGGESQTARRLATAGWGQAAATIAGNKSAAALHVAILMLAVGVLLSKFLGAKSSGFFTPSRVGAAVILFAAADQLLVSRHYVKSITADGFVAESEVTRVLKQSPDQRRLLLLNQSGFYNLWLTYLLPYHGIQTFNIAQMRMPEDYKRYFAAVGNQPANMWRQCAIGMAAGPGAAYGQLQASGSLSNLFRPVLGFNVVPTPSGGASVVPASQSQPPQHALFAMNAASPRYALIAGWEGLSDDDALKQLADPSRDYLGSTILTKEIAQTLPASSGHGVTGEVSISSYRPGRVALRVRSEVPAVLRVADKFEPWWRASIDGKPAPVLRCDYLFQGVFVSPGIHEVELKYLAPTPPLFVQLAGFGLCLVAILHATWTGRKNYASP